jgi:hypothetical protein
MTPDILDRLNSVVTRLDGLGIEADVDLARVAAPGVWVQWTGLGERTLGGWYVMADLVLMVPANAMPDAIEALQDLFDEVIEEFGAPDGLPRTQATALPDNPAPLPSLVLPYLIA